MIDMAILMPNTTLNRQPPECNVLPSAIPFAWEGISWKLAAQGYLTLSGRLWVAGLGNQIQPHRPRRWKTLSNRIVAHGCCEPWRIVSD
jgi:hypothetical protein